jgi:hypothetical protein
MNIVNLPNDIQYLFTTHLKHSRDVLSLKRTCRTFKTVVDKEIESQCFHVDLFKFKITLIFVNCDLKKHEMICKKISKFNKFFRLHKRHINRSHDTTKNIFYTTTHIYLEIYYDDVQLFKIKFNEFLKYTNLNNILKHKNNMIDYKLHLYYHDNIYYFIKNNVVKYREDLLIKEKSKLNLYTINNLLNIDCNTESKFIQNFDELPKKLGLNNISILHHYNNNIFTNNLILTISQILNNLELKIRHFKNNINELEHYINFELSSAMPDFEALDLMNNNLIIKKQKLRKFIRYKLAIVIKEKNIRRDLLSEFEEVSK